MRRFGLLVAMVLLVGGIAAPAGAGGAEVFHLPPGVSFTSNAWVSAFPDPVIVATVECFNAHVIVNPDGSHMETQNCVILESVPFLEFTHIGGGVFSATEVEAELPKEAVVINGPGAFGPAHSSCDWVGDGSGQFAESWRMTVTPAGLVYITSSYPSVPRVCEPNPG